MTSLRIYIICFAFCLTGQIAAQTITEHYTNHARYWYYRTRLRNDFMVVGSGQGMSIPMQERGLNYKPYENGAPYPAMNYNFTSNPLDNDGQTGSWGDAMSDLGYYIGTLAMEYKMLTENGQSESANQTLMELYYAMDAVNRLDLNGEVLWSQVDEISTPYTPALDGFMARDDVDKDFVINNYNKLNYFGNRGFCSKVKINNSENYNYDHLDDIFLEYKTSYSAAYYNNTHTQSSYSGAFISQDNFYNVLVGLALVRKYVPYGITYNGNTFRDGMSNINQEAFSIAFRTFNYFKKKPTWLLEYPDHSNIPNANGGNAYPFAFAFSEAMCKLDQNNWTYNNPTENWLSFHTSCEKDAWLNTGGFLYRKWKRFVSLPARKLTYALIPHRSCDLGNIGVLQEGVWKVNRLGSALSGNYNVLVMTGNVAAVCNCDYTFDGNVSMSEQRFLASLRETPHHPLLTLALFGYENSCSAMGNSFPTNAFNYAQSLVTNAPCETAETSGPFNYWIKNVGNVGPGFDPLYEEWSATSRLDHPHRRGVGNNDFIGEFNGIDYMFYHNLYYMARKYVSDDKYNKVVDYTTRNITFPYPVPGLQWGNDAHPANVGAYEFITASNTINSDANVNFTAGKSIDFKSGFTVVNGADFHATIDHLDCSSIFNSPNTPQYNVRQMQNYDSLVLFNSAPTSYNNQAVAINNEPTTPSNNSQVFIIKSKATKEQITINKFIDNVAIYPNPSNGIFKLAINNFKEVKGYQVKDVLGNVVFKGERISFENEINLYNVSKGVYSIVIEDINGNIYIKKAIIQ